jgi:hypothetical protein
MRYYGMDADGKFKVPRSNTLPVGTGPDDEGRLNYIRSDQKLYLHDATSWIEVGSGAGGAGGAYIYTQSAPSDTWTITHNLGVKYVNVEVVGSDDKTMHPNSITFVDNNSLVITFTSVQTGHAAVTTGGAGTSGSIYTGGSYIHTQLIASDTWTVNHGLGVRYVNVEVIGSDNKTLLPSDITFSDNNTLVITFAFNRTGYAAITVGAGTSGTSGNSGSSGTSGTSGITPTVIPVDTEILIRSDVAVSGFSLVTSINDELVYITKGSAAGGETGGTLKSGSTWTQPNHLHTTAAHTLTIAEIPSHNHTMNPCEETCIGETCYGISSGSGSIQSGYTGGGGSHTHGNTGSSTPSSAWRPTGRNFTIQKKL